MMETTGGIEIVIGIGGSHRYLYVITTNLEEREWPLTTTSDTAHITQKNQMPYIHVLEDQKQIQNGQYQHSTSFMSTLASHHPPDPFHPRRQYCLGKLDRPESRHLS